MRRTTHGWAAGILLAGGFVWNGGDYLGEPTPYYGARSSYFGIIDLAGFRKRTLGRANRADLRRTRHGRVGRLPRGGRQAADE